MSRKLTMSLESYLETIAELQIKFGAVRTSDLADEMGCKKSSVTSALQRLSEKGLINYQAYRPVTLTIEGHQAIERLSRFHGIIEDFLENVLDLPSDFSCEEACRLEHSLSKRTIERLKMFVDFIKTDTGKNKTAGIKNRFSKFLQDNED
ncbi:MAG: DtxR family transcriptional regulator, Mn-dependent transcriptional regulator [Clostridiales bacterium]|jgi:DtxR family Mn-dependent transcriptional regulator|nr:DtxR family transcriptional regulator, Mn-dependent transcriptional regulator [Clostridiales bacterium]MDN5281473.1 DtxR family transcriptional regulator, Mn-dependent transcriptional regulator [Candidatus Ozemobacter sp.]